MIMIIWRRWWWWWWCHKQLWNLSANSRSRPTGARLRTCGNLAPPRPEIESERTARNAFQTGPMFGVRGGERESSFGNWPSKSQRPPPPSLFYELALLYDICKYVVPGKTCNTHFSAYFNASSSQLRGSRPHFFFFFFFFLPLSHRAFFFFSFIITQEPPSSSPSSSSSSQVIQPRHG
jgi:hypothetical protein